MTGGANYGGGHHTRLREQLMSLWGAPAHVYTGGGREAGGQEGRAMWRVLLGLLVQVGFAPLPSNGEGKGERGEREKEKGGRAPTPCPIRIGLGGMRHLLAAASSLH